jgi:hypothetical protein
MTEDEINIEMRKQPAARNPETFMALLEQAMERDGIQQDFLDEVEQNQDFLNAIKNVAKSVKTKTP